MNKCAENLIVMTFFALFTRSEERAAPAKRRAGESSRIDIHAYALALMPGVNTPGSKRRRPAPPLISR